MDSRRGIGGRGVSERRGGRRDQGCDNYARIISGIQ